MSPEEAYGILVSIAEINGTPERLRKWELTQSDEEAAQVAEEVQEEADRKKSQPISIDQYFENKNEDLVKLYIELENRMKKSHSDIEIYVLPQYIAWRKNGKQFVEFTIQTKKIVALTLEPDRQYSIGEKVPDSFQWTLCYRTYIDSANQLNEAEKILEESYKKR